MLKLFLLIGLLKSLTITHKPTWCAGIYGAVSLFLGLVVGLTGNVSFSHIIISVLIETGLAFGYFWTLEKVDGTFLWWVIAIGVIGAIIFVSMAGLMPSRPVA